MHCLTGGWSDDEGVFFAAHAAALALVGGIAGVGLWHAISRQLAGLRARIDAIAARDFAAAGADVRGGFREIADAEAGLSRMLEEVRRHEAAMQVALDEAIRAGQAKSDFLANMSHELRTPLSSVLGLSESLQLNTYGELNEKQIKVLGTIEESGKHLLRLINDILDLSKINAGKFEISLEPFSLEEICQSSLNLTKGMSDKKKQHVSFSFPNKPIMIHADARRLNRRS